MLATMENPVQAGVNNNNDTNLIISQPRPSVTPHGRDIVLCRQIEEEK